MKRGTIEHPKMLLLEAALRISKIEAVGLMEALWHWAARYAPRGDIGKYTDEQIADGVFWPRKDCARLIAALVDKHWLDLHEEYRLVIHDWSEHAESSVRKYLHNQGMMFCDGNPPFKPRASRRNTLGIPDGDSGDDSGVLLRARVPSPSPSPSPTPSPLSGEGDAAHLILIGSTVLRTMTYEQDWAARRAAGVAGDPRLVEWAKKAADESVMFAELDQPAAWWRVRMEVYAGKKRGAKNAAPPEEKPARYIPLRERAEVQA